MSASCDLLGSFHDLRVECGGREDTVHQVPLDRLLALDALGQCAEDVGAVTSDHPLVDHPGESSGAREHTQEGHFGERHSGAAVVDQVDLLAG